MALDFNQRSFTKTADQVAIDEGLRAYMLKVYNYMTTGLLLTGFIAILVIIKRRNYGFRL